MYHPVGKGKVEKGFHRGRGSHTVGWSCENKAIRLLYRFGYPAFFSEAGAFALVLNAAVAAHAKMAQIPREKKLGYFIFSPYFFGNHTPDMVRAALVVLSVDKYYFHCEPPVSLCLRQAKTSP